MGIDYSVSMGYGIAIPDDKIPGVLKGLDEYDPYDEGVVINWLKSEGFDHIKYSLAGDYVCGETYMFFCVKSTYFRGEHTDMETITEFSASIEVEEHQEIRELALLLGVRGYEIGWKLFNNVS